MRFKLLRRRLTISAPRMAVRSAMPWPLRWAGVAIMLGFCAAISLWAFEFGKSIAGLDSGAKEELLRLRADVAKLREERDKAQSILNTSASLITAEKAAQERMAGADQVARSREPGAARRPRLLREADPHQRGRRRGHPGLAGRGARRHAAEMAGAGDPARQERAGIPRQAGNEHWRQPGRQALDDGPARRRRSRCSSASTAASKEWSTCRLMPW